jgi:hypothetical protein
MARLMKNGNSWLTQISNSAPSWSLFGEGAQRERPCWSELVFRTRGDGVERLA